MNKKHRRYREKSYYPTIGSIKGDRIHDFLKGWGTLCKDGSVLWDWWRPPTKRHLRKLNKHWEKHPPFSKMIFPIIKNMSESLTMDMLTSIQPMDSPKGDTFIY